MKTKEFAEACTEINEIFKYLDKYEVNKIPCEIRQIFNQFQSKDYIAHIDSSKPLHEQQLKKKTKDILVELYVKYWCKDEERQEINKILNENYEKKHSKLREKYNPDDIFKNRSKIKNYNEEKGLALVEYKESVFGKIINKISKFFRRWG